MMDGFISAHVMHMMGLEKSKTLVSLGQDYTKLANQPLEKQQSCTVPNLVWALALIPRTYFLSIKGHQQRQKLSTCFCEKSGSEGTFHGRGHCFAKLRAATLPDCIFFR